MFAPHGVTLPLALFWIGGMGRIQVQLEIGTKYMLHVLLRSTGDWELKSSEAFAARRKLLRRLLLGSFFISPTLARLSFCRSVRVSLCFIAAFALRFATFYILFTVNYIAKICRSLKMRCGISVWSSWI